jgi:uncharacterized membrane protein YecN with MAPEG domain
MKRAILTAVIYAALGIILAAAICAVIALVQALPSILSWVAGHIGEFMTWVVFIFIAVAVILYCIAE